MEIINSLEQLNSCDVPCVIALGTFDGLHLGHQDVIKTAKLSADKHNCKLAVFTFSNHPFSLIKPEAVPSRLITRDDKIECLKKIGVDILLDIPFEANLANLSPMDFIKKLSKLNFCCLVVGENFSFGCHGDGNVSTLKAFAKEMKFELIVRPLVDYDGVVVSSTEIRNLIVNGRIALANKMLGRSYSLQGEVVSGNRRGHLLDFPTANIELSSSPMTIPAKGVYAVQIAVGGKIYCGMSNVGVNPTFGDVDNIRLETNIFDFSEDIYGKCINVSFCEFIRGEKNFSAVNDLVEQLTKDKAVCRRFFGV